MNNSAEEQFSGYRVRPRFKVETEYPVEEVVTRIKESLKKEGSPCKGQVHVSNTTLYLPQEEQHYWSPQLSLSFEETETGCMVRGLYGPRPVVWTMFVFFYSIIGVAILFISVMGYSYLSLGKSGTILWLVPILLFVFLSLYLVAHFGQKLGHNQMITLHRFMEECMEITI